MSELSDIKAGLDELRNIVVDHIARTETYRTEKDKVMSAVTETIWDKDGKPGLATKVDRLNQIENDRKWTIRAIVIALLTGLADRFLHIFGR